MCVCMRSAYSLSTLARTHTTGRVYIYTHTHIYIPVGKKSIGISGRNTDRRRVANCFKKDEGLVDFSNLLYSWHLAVFDHVILILFHHSVCPWAIGSDHLSGIQHHLRLFFFVFEMQSAGSFLSSDRRSLVDGIIDTFDRCIWWCCISRLRFRRQPKPGRCV